jgi:hypothetical protein
MTRTEALMEAADNAERFGSVWVVSEDRESNSAYRFWAQPLKTATNPLLASPSYGIVWRSDHKA